MRSRARLRYGSAETNLDTYSHLWPVKDESTTMATHSGLNRRHLVLQTARRRTAKPSGRCSPPLHLTVVSPPCGLPDLRSASHAVAGPVVHGRSAAMARASWVRE